MRIRSLLLSALFLFSPAVLSANFIEEIGNCRFLKKLYSECNYCNYQPQDRLPIPDKKIHFWKIHYQGIDLVIPVDHYKEILIIPNDKKIFSQDLVIRGKSHKISITTYDGFSNQDYYFFESGMGYESGDINCFSFQAKKRLEQLRGIEWRNLLFKGKPLHLSKLAPSQEGWLFISGKEKHRVSWSNLYKPLKNNLILYKLTREIENHPKQLGGLLSQNRDDLISDAAPSPNWLVQIETALNRPFSQIKTSVIPALEKEGFSVIDTGGMSMIALER